MSSSPFNLHEASIDAFRGGFRTLPGLIKLDYLVDVAGRHAALPPRAPATRSK